MATALGCAGLGGRRTPGPCPHHKWGLKLPACGDQNCLAYSRQGASSHQFSLWKPEGLTSLPPLPGLAFPDPSPE